MTTTQIGVSDQAATSGPPTAKTDNSQVPNAPPGVGGTGPSSPAVRGAGPSDGGEPSSPARLSELESWLGAAWLILVTFAALVAVFALWPVAETVALTARN